MLINTFTHSVTQTFNAIIAEFHYVKSFEKVLQQKKKKVNMRKCWKIIDVIKRKGELNRNNKSNISEQNLRNSIAIEPIRASCVLRGLNG